MLNSFCRQSLYILLVLAFLSSASFGAEADRTQRVSGPYTHDNLSIYLLHGTSAPGPVPVTLEEAMKADYVKVKETGVVKALSIENVSEHEIFIQSGDIVKGGKQDRVLTVTGILAPRSGEIAIGSYCVEQGRWSARGNERLDYFSSSSRRAPSKELKLALKSAKAGEQQEAVDTDAVARILSDLQLQSHSPQEKVWRGVSAFHNSLRSRVGSEITGRSSPSSLQLALENKELEAIEMSYLKSLESIVENADDAIGYAFTTNGKFNSADLYASNALFRKMWPKLVRASVTEAIAEKDEKEKRATLSTNDVSALLKPMTQNINTQPLKSFGVQTTTSETDTRFEAYTSRSDSSFLHRELIAK